MYDTLATIPPQENLLTVPAGRQFMIVLADGTKVWLNAESSLRYNTSLVGNERRVVLTGEGYFEAAKNKRKTIYSSVCRWQADNFAAFLSACL